MNVVDSSGWLEYFADAENAAFFESAIEDVNHLVVPSINLYAEVPGATLGQLVAFMGFRGRFGGECVATNILDIILRIRHNIWHS